MRAPSKDTQGYRLISIRLKKLADDAPTLYQFVFQDSRKNEKILSLSHETMTHNVKVNSKNNSYVFKKRLLKDIFR